MPDYPYATELLLTLMQVAEADRDLPLEVLVNLHRQQLREPLLVLTGQRAAPLPATDRELLDAAYGMAKELGVAFPQVLLELRHSQWLMSKLAAADAYLDLPERLAPMRQLHDADPLTWALLLLAAGTGEAYDWYAHQPLAVLYPLTWGPEYYAAFLPILDEMLCTGPDARRLILEFAGLDAAAAQVPPWFEVAGARAFGSGGRPTRGVSYVLQVALEWMLLPLLVVMDGVDWVKRRLRKRGA